MAVEEDAADVGRVGDRGEITSPLCLSNSRIARRARPAASSVRPAGASPIACVRSVLTLVLRDVEEVHSIHGRLGSACLDAVDSGENPGERLLVVLQELDQPNTPVPLGVAASRLSFTFK